MKSAPALVDGVGVRELAHFCQHLCLDGRIAIGALPRERVDNPEGTSSPTRANSASPKPRVVPAEVPRRTPDVTNGFLGVEGDGVLVAGEAGALQGALGVAARHPLGRRSTRTM